MTEIPPLRVSEFLRIVLMRLWPESSGLPVRDVLMYIPQETQLSDSERELIPSSRTPKYERAVRLATAPYLRAGWLVKSQDRWVLTEEGKQACKSFATATAFFQQVGRMVDEWHEIRSLQAVTTEEAEENAWTQIRNYIQEMKPAEFHMLVEDLLTAIGYHLALVAPTEHERGFVNFVIHSDPLGLSMPRIKVHILHGSQPVLLEGMRAFMSVVGPEDVGIFISSGGFTINAIKEVQAQMSPRISLIDLENFVDLWVEYYDDLTDAGRQRFPLKPIHFLLPLE